VEEYQDESLWLINASQQFCRTRQGCRVLPLLVSLPSKRRRPGHGHSCRDLPRVARGSRLPGIGPVGIPFKDCRTKPRQAKLLTTLLGQTSTQSNKRVCEERCYVFACALPGVRVLKILDMDPILVDTNHWIFYERNYDELRPIIRAAISAHLAASSCVIDY
jgi:hypothetical protein